MGAPDSNWVKSEGEGWRRGGGGVAVRRTGGTQHGELGAHQCTAVHQELLCKGEGWRGRGEIVGE